MHHFHGGCHCGAIAVEYQTGIAPEETTPRACQCSFCRKHDARALSDPAGRLIITVHDETRLERYRFGLRSADFLLCRKCGVYVSAFLDDGDAAFGNVMVNVLDDRARFPDATPIDRSGEDAAGKTARRRAQWTPATLRILAQIDARPRRNRRVCAGFRTHRYKSRHNPPCRWNRGLSKGGAWSVTIFPG